jgi:nucleoside-diphosphate-sugar epimerase
VKAGPAVVYGPGTNKLPMVHIDDLAAYIAAAASEEVPTFFPLHLCLQEPKVKIKQWPDRLATVILVAFCSYLR